MYTTTFHTYRVLVLRWLFPVLAVVTLLAVVVWPLLQDMRLREISINSDTRLRVEEVALHMPKDKNAPARIEVSKPEFIGRDQQNRPFRVTADSVIQEGLQKDVPMTLNKPSARLTLSPETQASITLEGTQGVYDPKNKTLQLDGDVAVTHSTGYVLYMDDLNMDINAGSAVTKTPVKGSGPSGTLSGESMEFLEQGKHIILHGRSKITFDPQASGDTLKTETP